MSALVETVTGPIPASDLGVTLTHEHLWTRQEPVIMQWPHLYDVEAVTKVVVEQINSARERGLQTYCDATVMGLGRDVAFMRKIATITGVNIVASTGIYTFTTVPTYFDGRAIDAMVDAFLHDIRVGIQGTVSKAGFLKCATDVPGVTPGVEMVLRAVARAHRESGVPIMTHSAPSEHNGLVQQDVFEEEGVDLRCVNIGHSGDTDDVEYLSQIAQRGSIVGLDRFGMEERLEDKRRMDVVVELVDRGFGDRITLSHDHSIVRDIRHPDHVLAKRPNWNVRSIFDLIVPELVERGIDESVVRGMLTTTPQRWLTPVPRY